MAPGASVSQSDDAIVAAVPYAAKMSVRPRFHANNHSRDVLVIERLPMRVTNARAVAPAPTLEREGFELVRHRSAITDYRDPGEGERHIAEIRELLLAVSGADAVAVTPRGVLRFSERSSESGRLDNSRPARFVHVDVSDATAVVFATQANPHPERGVRRFCQYNVWRAFSPPPQDAPLAVCDARSVEPADLVPADAVFDVRDAPEWTFEALVVRGNPRHRWFYFRDMNRDEVLVFKANDSDRSRSHCVPHVAVDDTGCAPGTPPRASIEMRGTAFWYV
jgi:hypothetical protein